MAGCGIGADIIGFRDEENDNMYVGFSGAGLWGAGLEYHLGGGNSYIYYINIYDIADNQLDKILNNLIF